MDHYHFLACSASIKQKQLRLQLFTKLLQYLDTPLTLTNLIVHGLQSFYNSQTTNIHEFEHKAINRQSKNRMGQLQSGRISKQFTFMMNKHYKIKQRTNKFTGIGWTLQVIAFILSSHIEEWYHWYDSNSTPNLISFKDIFISLKKRSLLITIDFLYSRAKILPPADQKICFNSSIDKFKQYLTRRLKQWIVNTKQLFKMNKNNNTYGTRNITEYFEKVTGTTEKELSGQTQNT